MTDDGTVVVHHEGPDHGDVWAGYRRFVVELDGELLFDGALADEVVDEESPLSSATGVGAAIAQMVPEASAVETSHGIPDHAETRGRSEVDV